MSSETSSVILSVCGIVAVVGVLIFLAAFLVVHIFRSSLFGMAMMAFKIIGDPKAETGSPEVRAQAVGRQKRDLRAQAQSVDFDSAVARHGGKNVTQTTSVTPPPASPFSTQSSQAVNPQNTSTGQYPSLNKRRLQQRADDGEELDLLDAYSDDD